MFSSFHLYRSKLIEIKFNSDMLTVILYTIIYFSNHFADSHSKHFILSFGVKMENSKKHYLWNGPIYQKFCLL